MNTRVVLICLVASLTVLPVWAQVQLGGYVSTDWRARLENGALLWNENRLNLEIDASPTPEARVFAEFWIRGLGTSEAATTADLMAFDKPRSYPWAVLLREAYVDLYGFLTPNLDLRVGRQRIAWGSADKINPTDNLNPDDLEDIWDFGRHLGTTSLLAQYYWGDATVSTVFTPGFTPAVWPPASWATALSPPVSLPGGTAPGSISDELDLPENTLRGSASAAVKIARPILSYDLSLSYFRGRSDFPVPTRVVFMAGGGNSLDIRNTLAYPRMSVLGTDLSGAVGSVGIWAELAVFFPEEVHTIIDMSALGEDTQVATALPDECFARYVIGGDYTFRGGLYVNAQFIHGFVYEMGRDNLHDYLVGGVEKKFRNDTMKLTLAAAAEAPEATGAGHDYAVIGMPEIAYYPWDNSEILLGIRVIGKKGQATFARLADMDEAYVAVKYSF